jgi:hypothetical protein
MAEESSRPPEEAGESFERDFAAVLAEMRAQRRLCPAAEHLVALVEGKLGAAEREQAMSHVAVCADCAELLERTGAPPEEIDDVTWQRVARRLDERDKPWRDVAADLGGRSVTEPRRAPARAGWLAAAAAVVAVLGAGAGWLLTRPSSRPASETRGAALHAVAPTGRVRALDAFEWSSTVPVGLRFRVEVERGGQRIWQGEVDPPATRLVAPPELVARLASGGAARWRVVGLSPSGTVVAESAWIELELVASDPASP